MSAQNAHRFVAWTTAAFLASTFFAHTVALRLLLLIAGAAVAISLIASAKPSFRRVPPIWPPFALWAAWVACSLFWSHEPGRSLKEFHNEIGYTALALWVCFIGAQARDAAKVILPVVVTAGALVATVGIYHFVDDFSRYPSGLHGGSGNLSSALLTLMPCVLLTGWFAVRTGWALRAQLLLWSAGAILAWAAYTTMNRTIWIGFAVQLLITGWLTTIHGRGSLGLRTKIVAAALGFGIIVGGAGMVLQIQSQREASGAARAFSKDPRLELWSETTRQIEKRPLTGYGFGRGIMRKSLRDEFDDHMLWHAHNLVLDTLIQVGLPGLLLLLLLLGATVREGRRLAGSADKVAAACGIALIAVVAGMLVRNMTDILWLRQNSLLFWGITGVLLGLGQAQLASGERLGGSDGR
jgi:O-antigen ligase